MKLVKIFILSLFIISNAQNVSSQFVQSAEEIAEKERQRAQRQLDTRNKLNGYDNKGFIANRDKDKEPQPPSLYNGKEKERNDLKRTFNKTKNMVVVPETYNEKYKDFLKDDKVNLARLQPDKNCYGSYVVSIEELERCSDVIPVDSGGSLYSFKFSRNYTLKANAMHIEDGIRFIRTNPDLNIYKEVDWWNIHFINDKFVVQNSSKRGIISEIGDVDLNSIDQASKELEFLDNFKQKDTLAEVKEQSDALRNGISFNNFTYFNSSPVKLNSTYVLRSIDYSSIRAEREFLKLFPPEKQMQAKKAYKRVDKRADLTIVLKVVGLEEDGSVIILWKELKAGPLPN
jgi:hypothetical protein